MKREPVPENGRRVPVRGGDRSRDLRDCRSLFSRCLIPVFLFFVLLLFLTGCGTGDGSGSAAAPETPAEAGAVSSSAEETGSPGEISSQMEWKDFRKTGSMELQYAEMFAVDYYSPDNPGQAAGAGSESALITIEGEDRFLLLPEAKSHPPGSFLRHPGSGRCHNRLSHRLYPP